MSAEADSPTSRAQVLNLVTSAAKVVAQAALDDPKAVRPDSLSYQHILTTCSLVGRWAEALAIMSEMQISAADPSVDDLPEARAAHFFAAIRACTRDRRWKEAVELGSSVPASMLARDKYLTRLVLEAAAAAPDVTLAATLVSDHLRGIATPEDYVSLLRAARACNDGAAAQEAWESMHAAGLKPNEQCYAQMIGAQIGALKAVRNATDSSADCDIVKERRARGGTRSPTDAMTLLHQAASALEPPLAGVVATAALGSAINAQLLGLARESLVLLHKLGLTAEFSAQVRVLELGAEMGEWEALADEVLAAVERHAQGVEDYDRQALASVVEAAREAETTGKCRVGVVRALESLSQRIESATVRAQVGREKRDSLDSDAEEERRRASRRYSKSIAIAADATPIDVLFEDESLLAVSKPAGTSTTPRHRFEGESMVNRVVHYLGGRSPYVVHRLDNPTSGVLLFAKNRPSARSLSRQFASREVSKIYLATLCCEDGSRVPEQSFDVEAPIARHPTSSLLSFIPRKEHESVDLRAQHALTHFVTIKRGARAALCEARPVTGRMHQIRIHAEHAGWPIAGDTQYGAPLHPTLRCGRLLLHAHYLEVEHPELGTPMQFISPLPEDYLKELDLLGLNPNSPEQEYVGQTYNVVANGKRPEYH